MTVWCEKCGRRRTPCNCLMFRVVHPEIDPDYEHIIYAMSAADAAESYAFSYNEESADFSMMSGNDTIELLINGIPYSVTAEAVIQYYVTQK